jgi:hypothetical protein
MFPNTELKVRDILICGIIHFTRIICLNNRFLVGTLLKKVHLILNSIKEFNIHFPNMLVTL